MFLGYRGRTLVSPGFPLNLGCGDRGDLSCVINGKLAKIRDFPGHAGSEAAAAPGIPDNIPRHDACHIRPQAFCTAYLGKRMAVKLIPDFRGKADFYRPVSRIPWIRERNLQRDGLALQDLPFDNYVAKPI